MKRIPIHNKGETIKYVAGRAIPPQETRVFDAHEVRHLVPAEKKEPDVPTDPVLDLLDRPIKDIIPDLPNLSGDDIQRLKLAEQNGNTRETLIKAIDKDLARRAEVAQLMSDIQPLLGPDGTADDVQAALELYGKHAEVAEVLNSKLVELQADQSSEIDSADQSGGA